MVDRYPELLKEDERERVYFYDITCSDTDGY